MSVRVARCSVSLLLCPRIVVDSLQKLKLNSQHCDSPSEQSNTRPDFAASRSQGAVNTVSPPCVLAACVGSPCAFGCVGLLFFCCFGRVVSCCCCLRRVAGFCSAAVSRAVRQEVSVSVTCYFFPYTFRHASISSSSSNLASRQSAFSLVVAPFLHGRGMCSPPTVHDHSTNVVASRQPAG